MVRRPSARFVGLGAVVVSLLAGCGGSPSATPKKSTDSLLSEFFGGGLTQQEQGARFETQQRKQQEKVKSCMAKEGFVYVPFVQSASFSSAGPKAGEERDWKRKHGYGMADSMESFQPTPSLQTDPNQALRDKLSSADKRAYENALFGFDTTAQIGAPPQIPTGCMNAGFVDRSNIWSAINPKMEAMNKRIESDQRTTGVNTRWSSCMRSKGFTVRNEREIFEKVLIPAQQKVFSPPSSGSNENPGTPALPSNAGQPIGPNKAKVAELRTLELKLANADVDCLSKKDEAIRKAVRQEYETAFVKENRAALEQTKAANE